MSNVLFVGLFIILHESIEDLPGCFREYKTYGFVPLVKH